MDSAVAMGIIDIVVMDQSADKQENVRCGLFNRFKSKKDAE